ncbi:hypothetical protein HK102_004288, partial [Quaeritorhiza haematococci]
MDQDKKPTPTTAAKTLTKEALAPAKPTSRTSTFNLFSIPISDSQKTPLLGFFTSAVLFRLLLPILLPKVVDILSERVEVVTPVTSFKRLKEGLFLFENAIPPYDGGVYHQAPLLLALFHSIPPALHTILYVVCDILVAVCLVGIAQYKRTLQASEVWPTEPSREEIEFEEEQRRIREEGEEVDNEGDKEGKTGEGVTKEGTIGDVDEVQKGEKAGTSGEGESKKGEASRASLLGKSEGEDETKPPLTLVDPYWVGVLYLVNAYGIMACLAKSTQVFSTLACVAAVFFATR